MNRKRFIVTLVMGFIASFVQASPLHAVQVLPENGVSFTAIANTTSALPNASIVVTYSIECSAPMANLPTVYETVVHNGDFLTDYNSLLDMAFNDDRTTASATVTYGFAALGQYAFSAYGSACDENGPDQVTSFYSTTELVDVELEPDTYSAEVDVEFVGPGEFPTFETDAPGHYVAAWFFGGSLMEFGELDTYVLTPLWEWYAPATPTELELRIYEPTTELSIGMTTVNAPSPTASAVTTFVPPAPAAPAIVQVNPLTHSVLVEFTRSDGASSYVVTSTPDERECEVDDPGTDSTETLTCEVAGLAINQPYTFNVVAETEWATSEVSNSSEIVRPTHQASEPYVFEFRDKAPSSGNAEVFENAEKVEEEDRIVDGGRRWFVEGANWGALLAAQYSSGEWRTIDAGENIKLNALMKLSLELYGFAEKDSVAVYVDNRTLVKSIPTTRDGGVRTAVALPKSLKPGSHVVTIVGSSAEGYRRDLIFSVDIEKVGTAVHPDKAVVLIPSATSAYLRWVTPLTTAEIRDYEFFIGYGQGPLKIASSARSATGPLQLVRQSESGWTKFVAVTNYRDGRKAARVPFGIPGTWAFADSPERIKSGLNFTARRTSTGISVAISFPAKSQLSALRVVGKIGSAAWKTLASGSSKKKNFKIVLRGVPQWTQLRVIGIQTNGDVLMSDVSGIA